MRMKKWVVMILALAVVCLVGCGSGESASGVPGASGAAPVVSAGSIVSFGRYEQDNNRVNGPEPIEWLVLDVQGNRALLLSRYILDAKPFHTDYVDIFWEQCALRTWLNTDFISTAFSEREQSAILMTHVDNSGAQRYTSSPNFIPTGGNDTEDRVFLLSYYEAFQKYFSSNEARQCVPTDYAIANGAYVARYNAWSTEKDYLADGRAAGEWWLRTKNQMQNTADTVVTSGHFTGTAVERSRFLEAPGVRPALWINLGAEAFTGNGTESVGPAPEPAGDENGDPVTGDSRPGESVTEPEPAETAPPAPIEDESQPAEPTPEPEPAETAPSAPMEDESRPAEPTPEPQPAETAPPAPMEDESRPEEPTPEPKPAETAPPAPMEDESRPAEASSNVSIHVGSMMTYGTYEQDNDPQNGAEPIEWIVLDIRDGKALLLSRYGLDWKPYHREKMENSSWKDCSLRTWLNNDFFNTAFSSEDQEAILLTDVNNSDSPGYEDHDSGEKGNYYCESVGGENTQDYIFLLSFLEADLYDVFLSGETNYCKKTPYAAACVADEWEKQISTWRVRTAGTDGAAGYMVGDDRMFSPVESDDIVRPAMWIDLATAGIKAVPGNVSSTEGQTDPASFGTVGNVVTFGRFEQDDDDENGAEPIEWIVLDIRDGKALLLSRYALECAPYNDSRAEVTWETCTLRKWLNTSFLNGAFSQAERSAILVTDVDNSIEQGIDYEGVTGSNNTQDWVFLLSYHETEIYFDSREARACTPTAYAVARGAAKSSGRGALNGVSLTVWWLRSPGGFPCSAVYQFYDGGRESDYVDYDSWAVRPAMWVSLE